MNEDNVMRVIIIGVALFVFIFTFTAIILYYSTAIDVSEAVLEDTVDFGEAYELDLKDLEDEDIKGTEIINIIKNVSSDTNVSIIYDGIDYPMVRDRVGNIREGNLGIIKKATMYKIEDIKLNEDSLKIEISETPII